MAKEIQLYQSLGFLSNRINNLLRKRMAAKLDEKKTGLSVEGYQLIQCLWEQDGQSQNSLARLLGYDRPRMSRLIDELEETLWVKRVAHPDNNREKLIMLNRKAKDRKPALLKIADDLHAEAFKGINATRKKDLMSSLNTILSNMDL